MYGIFPFLRFFARGVKTLRFVLPHQGLFIVEDFCRTPVTNLHSQILHLQILHSQILYETHIKPCFTLFYFMNNYYHKDTIVFYNGTFQKIADVNTGLFSQTLHYGYGAFEGIRAYNTGTDIHLLKAREHFERLTESARQLHLETKYTPAQMQEICDELLEANRLTDAYIRPLITSGEDLTLQPSGEGHLFIAAWHWGRFMGDDPVSVHISSYRHPHASPKLRKAKICGNYVSAIMATQEARANGYNEALLTDDRGFVAEGAGANFFYEQDGRLYTPDAHSVLPGITRKTVMQLANEMGVEVVERDIHPQELSRADGAFFTGTASEISGIKSIGSKEFKMPFEESLGGQLAVAYKSLALCRRETTMV